MCPPSLASSNRTPRASKRSSGWPPFSVAESAPKVRLLLRVDIDRPVVVERNRDAVRDRVLERDRAPPIGGAHEDHVGVRYPIPVRLVVVGDAEERPEAGLVEAFDVDRHEAEPTIELTRVADAQALGELVEDRGGEAADCLHRNRHAPRYCSWRDSVEPRSKNGALDNDDPLGDSLLIEWEACRDAFLEAMAVRGAFYTTSLNTKAPAPSRMMNSSPASVS
jgi:hypothetical protein